MHTITALPWVAFVPMPCGSCHHGIGQGCLSYWHPSLSTEELCFPRQVSLCLTMILGDRLNIAAPFPARELAFCPCVSGRYCLGAALRRWLSPGHPTQPDLPALVTCCHGDPAPIFTLYLPLAGPCFFLSCPIGIEDFRTWFIDLWNNSIIPYLQEGAKDGLKVPRAA